MPDPHSTASIFWLLPAILLLLYALAAIGVFLLRGKGAHERTSRGQGGQGDKGTRGQGGQGRQGTRGQGRQGDKGE
ncbi:hypothetical protein [Chroococcidiopsis cubana]|uniref:hypothetical protein n=1 Tax=Chroococcidiopsis cubana TaxID=171392 RepID=UPI002ACE168A|nr:hypothetical protein [Chroococcidiopsis cubana]